MILILAVGGWVVYARLVRGQVLACGQRRSSRRRGPRGRPDTRILAVHVLPNIVSPIVVLGRFVAPGAIVLASRAVLPGLGRPAAHAELGRPGQRGARTITVAWWLTTFPGAAIMLTVLGINFLGDWLRDLLDPRLQSV